MAADARIPITEHGPFLKMEAHNGPTFIQWQLIVRVATGQHGDALVLFSDGKHEFVKHTPIEVIEAWTKVRERERDGLARMREPA